MHDQVHLSSHVPSIHAGRANRLLSQLIYRLGLSALHPQSSQYEPSSAWAELRGNPRMSAEVRALFVEQVSWTPSSQVIAKATTGCNYTTNLHQAHHRRVCASCVRQLRRVPRQAPTRRSFSYPSYLSSYPRIRPLRQPAFGISPVS
jgi:hypothetical protein